MIAIPNMVKPKKCEGCMYQEGNLCDLNNKDFGTWTEQYEHCPLIEIVTCGECKYANYLTEDTDVKCMITQLFMDKSGFCSYEERRER